MSTQEQVNDGGAAFPVQALSLHTGEYVDGATGMSLRDYFAVQALMGMIAFPDNEGRASVDVWAKELSEHAYKYADAMLAERAK